MKRSNVAKFLVTGLCGAMATTAALAQPATFVWTNNAGGDIAIAANWDPNGVPNPNNDPGDILQWDGRTTGDLSLTANTGLVGGSGGTDRGLLFHLTANQTSAVNISSPVSISAGTRFRGIAVDAGAGAFSLGNSSLNVLDILVGGAFGPQVIGLTNNSASPVTIHPNVRTRIGGGNAHTYTFDGTGDWIINNHLRSLNNTPMLFAKYGSGTLTWTFTNVPNAGFNSVIASPINLQGGTLILKSANLIDTQRITNNGTLLHYDAPVGAGTFSGPIHGTGLLRISAGSLTLSSGASDFSGNIDLAGGTLIIGGVQNPETGPLGTTGMILFNGGTLAYGVANSFDYSPRFSNAAGQNYRIDTAGQNVMLTNAITSSGGTLTKLGSGTLTLTGANTYSGATTISAGRLVIEGSAGSGAITVANSTALGVRASGTPITPATLTVGTSAGATLEFNNVNSTTTPLIQAGTISAGGAVTVNVNSGTFIVGQSYPLFSWSGGSAPAVSLGLVVGAVGTLSTNGSTVQLTVSALADSWTGANNGNWDTFTAGNWLRSGSPVVFADGDAALFDDTATGETNIVVNSPVAPANTTVNSSAKSYNITSSGANAIGGPGGLTKNGNSVLTLSGGANTYSGATTISGGTVSVSALASGGAASDIGQSGNAAANLVLNGGSLQYTGGAQTSDRLFTLGAAGGTIDASGSGALTLNNNGSIVSAGTGARTLTLSGNLAEDNLLAGSLSDNGGATALTKSGSGKWIVSGNNAISGTVTITGGTLQIGAGGNSGSVGSGNIANNGTLIFNRTGAVTNGTITGSGSLTVDGGGAVVLPGNNTYSGGTTIAAGTLQVGNGGPTGSLRSDAPIVNEGTLIFDTTGSFNYTGNGLISGAGNVIVRGNGGWIKAIGANSYSGWTRIESGATFQPTEGNTGQLLSSVVTNNGTLMFVAQDPRPAYAGSIVGSGRVQMGANNFNAGSMTLTGTNNYTGGTFIGDNELIFGDGGTPEAGSFVGDVIFTNNFGLTLDDNPRTLTFNRPDDFTFSGNIVTNFAIPQNNRGRIQQNGGGVLTLTGNNTYAGGTLINAGTVQVGNGGTSGSLGFGEVVNNSFLVFNRSDNVVFNDLISGGGSLVKMGAGMLTLRTNTYFGTTTVSNGTLIINGDHASSMTTVYGGLGGTGVYSGSILLEAGSILALGADGVIGTLTANSDLAIGGSITVNVNKSLAQSNDMVVANSTLSKTGAGTLTVANLGPTLAVGDKFTLFNQPLTGGASLTVTGGGATWQNKLADDGTIVVLTVTQVTPPTLNFSRSGNNLQFSWTGGGFKLQSQTNSLSVGLTNNWADYPGGGISPVSVPLDATKGAVFFRLAPTP